MKKHQPATERGYERRGIQWDSLDPKVVIGIAAMHVGALLAFWPATFSWTGVAIFVFLAWITGSVGITLSWHRQLTHRSFKSPKWFEYLLCLCGCLAWQGGPAQWVGIHRLHHKHSDEEDDPHTPHHGFTWSHVLWCLHYEIDGKRGVDAAKDLMRDPVINLMQRYFWVPQFLMIPVLYFGGEWAASAGWSASGLSWLVWGIFVRTTFVYHITWFVNSATHTWGYRNFETTDSSTNLWWVALLAFGEGWHNNHHAHQRSAAHGLRWYEVDLTYNMIRVLKLFGLAYDIVLPKPDQMPDAADAKKQKALEESRAIGSVSADRPAA